MVEAYRGSGESNEATAPEGGTGVRKKKGLSKAEAEEAVDAALLKKAAGKPLSKNDEDILAYLWYAPICHHRECCRQPRP